MSNAAIETRKRWIGIEQRARTRMNKVNMRLIFQMYTVRAQLNESASCSRKDRKKVIPWRPAVHLSLR